MSTTIRNALVTGATSGIGQAIAEILAAQGHRVVVSGRDRKRGEQVVGRIAAAGGKAHFVAADLASLPALNALIAGAKECVGNIDILVNNAGIFSFGPTVEATESGFDAMYGTNVKAPFFLTARLAGDMAARGWGRIVNVTTMVAHFGMPGAAIYGSSKAALRLLTQVWAAEFGPSGVTVNAVAPGPISTPGTEVMAEALEHLASTLPARRVGKPEEIASAVSYLVSDQAGYVNGATLNVDGGRTAV